MNKRNPNLYVSFSAQYQLPPSYAAFTICSNRSSFIFALAVCTAYQERRYDAIRAFTIQKRDIVATLFVLILQIFGRLARVTDITRPKPHVYFIDGAFRGREEKPEDFDCLTELGKYLEHPMTQKESAEIAQTLYAPFYKAYRKDILHE